LARISTILVVEVYPASRAVDDQHLYLLTASAARKRITKLGIYTWPR
jgi:hypothetical protein